MTDAAAVDWTVLQTLAEQMGDDEIVGEVLAAYQAEIPGRRAALDAARTGTATQLQSAAHALKASSQSIGALRLGDLCREVESLARADDHSRAADVATAALAELERVERELASGQEGSNR
jgi:HPt (histidine-containing phosphotransfer) domain-containing protein